MIVSDRALRHLSDSDLVHVAGGTEPITSVDWTKESSTINGRALVSSMATGAVTGGLGAAAISGGPGWAMGAVGGAAIGGIAYSVDNLINPPKPEPVQPSSTLSWGEEGFSAYR